MAGYCKECGTSAADTYMNIYSSRDVQVQEVLYGIWTGICFALLLTNVRHCAKLLQAAVFLLFVSYLLQCLRYSFIRYDRPVSADFRNESAAAEVCQRLGIDFLLGAVLYRLHPRPNAGIVAWLALITVFILTIPYAVYSFQLASAAIRRWDVLGWRLGDRDVGLTMTPWMVDRFTRSQTWSRMTFQKYRMSLLHAAPGTHFKEARGAQVIIGAVTDAIIFLLVLQLFVILAYSSPTLKDRPQAKAVSLRVHIVLVVADRFG